MSRSLRSGCLAIAALLAVARSAFAIVSVGPDTGSSGCAFRTIQDAIDYVHFYEVNHPLDVDPYIVVAGGYRYTESLLVNDRNDVNDYIDPTGYQGEFIQIYGDYDPTCHFENGSVAEMAAGSNGDSVMEIQGHSHVVLNHVRLSGATNVTRGGGISFHNGSGTLELSNTEITSNAAGYGAGVYVNGAAPGIAVYLHAGTLIDANTAAHAGGGMRIEGEAHLFMVDPSTTIANNTANPQDGDGAGGGLQLLGGSVTADIASPGYFGVPAVYGNRARVGGGIAVQGAILRLSSGKNRGGNTGVVGNDASAGGGGIYLEGHVSSQTTARVCTFGAEIDRNSAADGGAIFTSGDSNVISLGRFHGSCVPPYAPPPLNDGSGVCYAGSLCSTVRNNVSSLDNASTIRLASYGDLEIANTEMRGNSAGSLLFSGSPTHNDELVVENSALLQNHVRHQLVYASSGAPVRVNSCTIAGNTFDDTSAVISSLDTYVVYNSIIWQPGNTVLDFGRGASNMYADHVMFSDIQRVTQQSGSFGTFTYVSGSDPQFLDATSGNYTLSARSPAIDFATSSDFSYDVLLNRRGVDSDPARAGLYDIGAYEFQGTNPLFGSEGSALQALYSATNGDQWLRRDGWLDFTSDPCTWIGIACNPDHTHVIAIALTGNHLTGQLPDLSAFAFLQRFYVDGNQLSGPIPDLGNLQYLKEFGASSNQLTGSILGLDHLTQLTYFDVRKNQLSGPLPSLGANPLAHFRVDDNHLTGAPPPAPPIPFTYQVGDFELCPNSFDKVNDPNWDMLVSFGAMPWWSGCERIFRDGFDGT